jgi:hypothetical protein
MGMFDWVYYACTCDNCKSRVHGFQTKSGKNILDTVKPTDVDEFYSSCDKCGLWIEFHRVKGNGYKKQTMRWKDGKRKIYIQRFVKIRSKP